MPTIELILTPGDTTVASNSTVQYSTQGSSCSDGTELTYAWSFTVPISGSYSVTSVEQDGDVFTLYPDINGGYTVTVVATSASGVTATKTSRLLVVSDTAYLLRQKEKFDIIGDSIGDFWKYIDNNQVFKSLWEEYAKCISADYRYLSDTYLSNSISTIREGKIVTDTVTNSLYIPPSGETVVKASHSYYGNNASTEDSIVTGVTSAVVGMTDTVYIPADSVGGNGFFSKKTSTQTITVARDGKVTLQSPNYWFSQSSVKILTGGAAGRRTNLVSVGNQYVLDPVIPSIVEGESSATIRVRIEKEGFASGLLLNVDGLSAPIKAVSYLTSQSGYVAKIQTEYPVFPGNKTNLNWRICNTLKHTGGMFEQNGVVAGDTIRFRMSSSFTQKRFSIDCLVAGVYKDYISFEITDSLLVDSNGTELAPSISDATFHYWCESAGINGSTQNTDGTYSFEGVAGIALQAFNKASSIHVYNTINASLFVSEADNRFATIYATTSLRGNAAFRLAYALEHVKRNTLIQLPTEDRVLSCGIISEYVYQKDTHQMTDGTTLVLHEDGSTVFRNTAESILYENIHYVVCNYCKFNGSFNKEQGSLTITDGNGFFVSKGISAGYEFVHDGIKYFVLEVVSETELTLANTKEAIAIQPIKLIEEFYTIAKPRTSNHAYLRVRSGLFNISNPIPNNLFIPAVIVSNDKRVEDNFGILTKYMLSDYRDYSAPSISYVSAVMGLMYARLSGVTRATANIVSAILCNAAITETACIVRKIDPSSGKITVELLNNSGIAAGTLVSYSYTTEYSTEPFTTIGINPNTDEEIEVGDVLPPFTLLTGKIRSEDAYTYPQLFSGLRAKKYHSWGIMLAAEAVKSKEIRFLQKFFSDAAPAHVLLQVLYVVTLLDEIYVEDDVDFYANLKLIDSSSLSSESAAIVDARNNSDQVLTALGLPDISTRTLFLGRDLVATSSTRVESARGGFSLGSSTTLNKDAPFGGVYNVRGGSLVKSGDILRVYNGVNVGVFVINTVVSDNELDVTPIDTRLPYTPTALTVSDVKANYAVLRPILDYIVSGLSPDNVNNTIATFSGEEFIWDNLAVGDIIVNEADFTDRHAVVSVQNSSLETDSALSTQNSYLIYREAALYKRYAEDQVFVYDSNTPTYVSHSISNGFLIEIGDVVEVTSGPNITLEAVITYVGHDFFLIDIDILTSGCTITLRKDWLPEDGQIDYKLERLHGFDRVVTTLTSTGAICNVSTKQTGPNGLEYFVVYNSVNAAPGDFVVLYDGATKMLESRVWMLDSTGDPVCIVLYEDPGLSTSTSYSVIIEKQQ